MTEIAISVLKIVVKILDGEYGLKITDKETIFIKKLISNNPEVFEKISEKINYILNNKKITIYTIPKVISIISILYKENIILDNDDIEIDIINIIQITILGLIYANIFNFDKELNEELEKIVKYSIILLRTNIELIKKEEKKCYLFCCG